VIERTAKRPDHDAQLEQARSSARANLDQFQRDKPRASWLTA